LNVAIVASELPYPPTAGNRIRTLNLALRLAPRHRITFIAHRNDEADEATRFLGRHGIGAELVDRAIPAKSGPRFYARLAMNLASPLPYSVASHSSRAIRDAVRSFARRQEVDVWQLEAVMLADAMADLGPVPRVLIAHNVESLIWRRYFETASSPLRRWYIREQWRKFERFERRAFAGATRVVAVSEPDAALIRGQLGGRRVDVVDNGVDRGYYEAVRRQPDPRTLLFLGSLDWRPNVDAIGLLLDRVFPAVRAAEPEARLLIVGRKPSAALAGRAGEASGVELHADVPDVRPYLARSTAMVVPLRIGGGSRLKILEAAAAGLPVISTRVGAEGLDLIPEEHYVAADEPEEMTEALVGCFHEPAAARARAERARALVLERHDWDVLADQLEAAWLGCLGGEARDSRDRARSGSLS
jgi:glycosyltransferase involved in cell wall biosynthesis